MTLATLLLSTTVVAQIPTFPWNPDENDDQFVGLSDLLGLLAVYGEEFANAIVSEDGESAVVYVGNSKMINCQYNCAALPGGWHMPEPYELVPVLDEITWVNGQGCTYAWLKDVTDNPIFQKACHYQGSLEISGAGYSDVARCYCTAKQLPRVEYDTCQGQDEDFQACCDEKTADGWYPLGGISLDQIGAKYQKQAFWRFAH